MFLSAILGIYWLNQNRDYPPQITCRKRLSRTVVKIIEEIRNSWTVTEAHVLLPMHELTFDQVCPISLRNFECSLEAYVREV